MKQAKPKPKSKASLIPAEDELNIPPTRLLDYTICLYGTKGIGKTSLASSIPNSVTIMTEPTRRNLKIRMAGLYVNSSQDIHDGIERDYKSASGEVISTYVDAWQFFKEELLPQLLEDDSVSCINIDTVDRMYDACSSSVCTSNGVFHPGGLNDFGAMWSAVKSEFESVLSEIRFAGKGLILISHAKEDDVELNTGSKAKIYAPSCAGQALSYIKAAADYAFFYGNHGKERCLHFRGFDKIWTACGPSDHFYSPNGNPLELVSMEGKDWSYVEEAFNNQVYDLNEVPVVSTVSTPKKKVKK